MGKALTQQRGAEVGDAARWPRVRLGDVCEGKIDRIKALLPESTISYIDIGSVNRENKKILSTTSYPIAHAPGRAQQLVRVGDLLVSTVRPNLNAVALVEQGACQHLVASTGFCVVRPKSELDSRFIYYFSQTNAFIDPLVTVSEKASYPSVTDAIVRDLLIPLPPLPVQREIVARLERELGAADKLAKKFEELESAAEAEFKAELKETFEGAENKIQLAELEDSGRVVMGRGKIISKKDIAAHPGGYPVYSSSATGNGEIGRYGLYMFEDERITWSIDGGGRLYCRSAHRYSVTNVCGWLQVKDSAIEIRYLYYALTDAWSRIDFNYTHKAHPSVIRKEYFVAIPTLSAQRETVARLDAAKAKKEKLVAAARRGRETAALMRKAILKEAFE